MKLFKIHTEENGKDVDFGVHGVYADNFVHLQLERRE